MTDKGLLLIDIQGVGYSGRRAEGGIIFPSNVKSLPPRCACKENKTIGGAVVNAGVGGRRKLRRLRERVLVPRVYTMSLSLAGAGGRRQFSGWGGHGSLSSSMLKVEVDVVSVDEVAGKRVSDGGLSSAPNYVSRATSEITTSSKCTQQPHYCNRDKGRLQTSTSGRNPLQTVTNM